MSRTLSAAVETASRADTVFPAFLAAVETSSGFLRMWTGYGDLAWGGNTYTGAGDLLGVSPIQETDDLAATGLRFSLSGVPASLISVAINNARQGLSAKLWLACLDASGAVIGDPILMFSGLTDVPEIEEGGETCTLTMTAESRLIDLDRARVRRYTAEDQKAVHPTDKGFDYVPSLQDKEIVFGRS
jgi:hypothetical protein